MNSRIRSLLAASPLLLLVACSHRHPASGPAVASAAPRAPTVSADPSSAAPAPPPTTEVLMLNGGGSPYINYQSHLLHLQSLRDLVLRAGVSPERLSVLASDGSDPAPDLATRDAQPEPDFWRLEGTRLEHRLEMPTTTIDSKLAGLTLAPATKASLTAWFDAASKRLHSGDTLLLYVTDHGTRHGDDPVNNRITLWGNGDDAVISVRELAALVGKLDPGVKVVSLMSQCFSGGFAALSSARSSKEGEPAGNVCGYFSSTADRRAYGCYAENRGKANVGHSFEFIRALSQSGSFREAHDAVLASDDTPDVPLRSSDAYLESVVRRDAEARHVALGARADELLRQAFLDPGAWQTETRQIDRVAQATGSFSPRSLGELEDLSKRLPETDGHLTSVSRAWREALGDANASNVDRLIAARPDWAERLAEPALAKLDAAGARALTASLLHDLAELSGRDPAQGKRLEALKTRGDASEAASYRMQVRLAVVLRMRALLMSIAGRELLLHGGTLAQKAALTALSACEDLSLPKTAAAASPIESAQPARAPAPYPPFEEDMKLTESALPGWMGISFKEPSEDLRKKGHLPAGASLVSLVFPDSPAKAAGFEIGDIVLGPPGAPFESKNQIRQWTMLSEIGKPGKLEILRDGAHRQLAITPRPYPMKWPALPGPTAVGTVAPKIDLKPYRGAVAADVKKSTKHVLYFLATWCGPCKAALPELLAFEKEHHVPIVAVTDEDPKVLDAFFEKWSAPFPAAVGVDEFRRSFVMYGVSGTPTFVLVDEKGNVAAHQVGYDPGVGLALPGWTWSGRKAPGVKP
ncbi:MAG TPA: thioredoxin-like domain-containing protein [Polyangiaceae bacterium]